MNKLVWLWDVLVRERRITRWQEAINASYEAGYHQCLDDMFIAAKERSLQEMTNLARRA